MKAFYLSMIILALILAAQVDYYVGAQNPRSTSPLNPGPMGSQEFYKILKSLGYDVKLGEFKDLRGLRGVAGLLIVGPDKRLSREELDLIVNLWEEGRLILVAADETGILRDLYKALGVEFDTIYVMRPGSKGWEHVVSVECLDFNIFSTKVSTLKPRGAPGVKLEAICRLEDGRPIAFHVTNGASRAILLGDSSLFANFLINGYLDLKPTRQAATAIVDYVGLREVEKIIYDISHYNITRIPLAGTIRASIAVLGIFLETLKQHNIEAYKITLTVIAASLLTTLLVIGAPRTPPKIRNPLIEEAIEYAKTIKKKTL